MIKSQLDKAINIAATAHADQLDKAGQPYILHPLRLMLQFNTESARIVAIMHDVIEDSHYTFTDLKKAGFSDAIITAIDCLTKRNHEDYHDFIERVSQNEIATKVKIADIKDNLDITRLTELSEQDLQRIKKYHSA